MGGAGDNDVPLSSLSRWGQFFTKPAEVHTFAGGHFFIESHQNVVLALIKQLLQNWLSGAIRAHCHDKLVAV
jgi:surfactin synthase thioesterase subunit